MKKYFMMAAALLLAATSCTNESVNDVVENNAEQGYAPVTVRVSGFSITQEEMPSGGGTTRAAQNPADYTDVGAITLAFYDAAGTEVYKTTQIKGDDSYTTFGEFTANLQVGTYTMVAVARAHYDGDAFTLTSPTEAAYTSMRPRETFSKVQTVTVTSASPLDLSVTLNRINSWLKIISTDGRPASIKKIRTTFEKGGKSFNPTTGWATTDTGFSQTNNPSTATGATIEINVVPFVACADDAEEKMTITIEALDNDDNVLGTKVVNNVPFKRNRQTILRGNVFTAEPTTSSFKIETAWLSDYTMDF
jgi:hypothetical protein